MCLALEDTAPWSGPWFRVACDTEPLPSVLTAPPDATTDYSGSSCTRRRGRLPPGHRCVAKPVFSWAQAPRHTSSAPWSCTKLPRRHCSGHSFRGAGASGGRGADGAVHSTTREDRPLPLLGQKRPSVVSWPPGICWSPRTQHGSWLSAALAAARAGQLW